jgi:hypothetical protein
MEEYVLCAVVAVVMKTVALKGIKLNNDYTRMAHI